MFYDRYANMDFIVFYTLMFSVLTTIVFSYDIACQWYRNLKTRMHRLPREMWIATDIFLALRFFIPKLHIYAHGAKCQHKYSFNFQRWSARTDGEDPERFWSHINPASLSTREMSPGARFDALDSHAAHWNWRKITRLGMSVFHESVSGFTGRPPLPPRSISCVTIDGSPQRTCTPSCLFS